MLRRSRSKAVVSYALPSRNRLMVTNVVIQTTILVMARPVPAESILLVNIFERPTGLANRKSAVFSLSSMETREKP